jgi:hypothetical protein
MALLFIDSFDHYTATADANLKGWTVISTGSMSIAAGAGRRSTAGMRTPTAGGLVQLISTAPTPSGDTMICGFSVLPGGWTAGTVFRLRESSIDHVSITIKTDGALEARRGSGSGTILGTSMANALPLGVTSYLEVKIKLHDSAGTVEIRRNGDVASPILSLTSVDTNNAGTSTWTAVVLGGPSATAYTYDDFYLLDGTGSAPWNTFLGDCRVDVQYPTANGTTSNSTPSTGTNRGLTIDETAPNSDTDYNTLIAVGDKDTLALANLTAAGASLFGVQTLLYAKKTDAGTGSVCPVLRHSTTDYDGTSVALTTGYTYIRQLYQTNPGTSTQWTEAEFNALEVGYKRTA